MQIFTLYWLNNTKEILEYPDINTLLDDQFCVGSLTALDFIISRKGNNIKFWTFQEIYDVINNIKGAYEEFQGDHNKMERPYIGVGVLIYKPNGQALFGKRKGSHGANTWGLPGGHLEFGESILDCALREVLEETGISLFDYGLAKGPYTESTFNNKQYVTIIVLAEWTPFNGEPVIKEPDKMSEWRWDNWNNLSSDIRNNLFDPLKTLVPNTLEYLISKYGG